MSNLVKHAESEMAIVWPEAEPMQDMVKASILELMKVFAAQGHSGSSAPYVLAAFGKLAAFEPLGPITGIDAEWVDVGDGRFQNKRCCHVFKSDSRFNGQAYDLNGIIYEEPNGSCYSGKGSAVPITFPYEPSTLFIKVDEKGNPLQM